MSNVHELPGATTPPKGKIDVALLIRMVDMLFVAGVIEADSLRLAFYCAAEMQRQGDYFIQITRKGAANTCVVVDGKPTSAPTNTENECFAKALTMLQATCGLYSHTSAAKCRKAKDRFTSFACDLRGDLGDMYTLIGEDEPVFVQFRPEMSDTLYHEAQEAIERKLWRARFAHIDTTAIEAKM